MKSKSFLIFFSIMILGIGGFFAYMYWYPNLTPDELKIRCNAYSIDACEKDHLCANSQVHIICPDGADCSGGGLRCMPKAQQ